MGSPGVGMTLTEGLKALRAYEPSHDAMRARPAQRLRWPNPALDHRRAAGDPRTRPAQPTAPTRHQPRRRRSSSPRHKGTANSASPSDARLRAITHARAARYTAARTRWFRCRCRSRCSAYCQRRPARVRRLRSLDPDRAGRRVLRAGRRLPGPAMSTGVEAQHPQEAEVAAQLPIINDDLAAQRFRVHRSAMTSPRIHRAESEQIFDRCWLYVGHESEIPSPATSSGATSAAADHLRAWRRRRGPGAVQLVHPPRRDDLPSGFRQRSHLPVLLPRVDVRHDGGSSRVPDEAGYGRPMLRQAGPARRVPGIASRYRGFLLRQLQPRLADSSTTSPVRRTTSISSPTRGRSRRDSARGPTSTASAPTGSSWSRTASTATTRTSTHDTYFDYLRTIGSLRDWRQTAGQPTSATVTPSSSTARLGPSGRRAGSR